MEIDHTEGERPTGGSQSTKGLRASFDPLGLARQAGKWFSWAFFRGPWARARMGASPILEGSQSCGGASLLSRGGEGSGARAASSEPPR